MRDDLKKKTPYLLKINRGVVCVGVGDVRVDRQRGRHSGRPLPAALLEQGTLFQWTPRATGGGDKNLGPNSIENSLRVICLGTSKYRFM